MIQYGVEKYAIYDLIHQVFTLVQYDKVGVKLVQYDEKIQQLLKSVV